MARRVKVAQVGELSPGQGKRVQVEGNDIALFNVNGTFHAVGAVCPHEEGPLYEGEVEGESIVCPWHGYDFDVRSGQCSVDSELRVPTYVVRTEGDDVFIEMA